MFQQVVLLGNLGDAPELRFTPSGTPVANFSLAVNKAWTRQEQATERATPTACLGDSWLALKAVRYQISAFRLQHTEFSFRYQHSASDG